MQCLCIFVRKAGKKSIETETQLKMMIRRKA